MRNKHINQKAAHKPGRFHRIRHGVERGNPPTAVFTNTAHQDIRGQLSRKPYSAPPQTRPLRNDSGACPRAAGDNRIGLLQMRFGGRIRPRRIRGGRTEAVPFSPRPEYRPAVQTARKQRPLPRYRHSGKPPPACREAPGHGRSCPPWWCSDPLVRIQPGHFPPAA